MAEAVAESNPKLNVGSLRIGLFTDTYAPQINGVSISLQSRRDYSAQVIR